MKINLVNEDFEKFMELNGFPVEALPEGLADLLRGFYAAGALNTVNRLSLSRMDTIKNWRESAAEYLEGPRVAKKRPRGRPRKDQGKPLALSQAIKKTAERYKECDCCGDKKPGVIVTQVGYLGDAGICLDCRVGRR